MQVRTAHTHLTMLEWKHALDAFSEKCLYDSLHLRNELRKEFMELPAVTLGDGCRQLQRGYVAEQAALPPHDGPIRLWWRTKQRNSIAGT